MKHYPSILAISALVTLVVCQSHAYTLVVGTNALDVVFAHTGISTSVAERIVADIALVRNAWTNGETTIHWNFGSVPLTGLLREDSRVAGPYSWICPVELPRDLLVTSNSLPSLLISTQVVDAYTNAFQFIDTHFSVISNAYGFVEFLNSPEYSQLQPEDYEDVVLMQDYSGIDRASFIADLAAYAYSLPSALSFYRDGTGHTPPVSGADANICVAIPAKYGDNLDTVPAIWHEGRWKLNLWRFER